MKTQKLKIEIDKRLSEINGKILRLKNQLGKNKTNEKLEGSIADLIAARDEVVKKYDELSAVKADDTGKNQELETAIFSSIKAFDEAYKKAGVSMNTVQFNKRRKRSVDFNNPVGTK